MLDWIDRPAQLVLLAVLGPGPRSASRRCSGACAAPVDALLDEEIARRRAAPDLDERDDILSMLLLARDEDGAR